MIGKAAAVLHHAVDLAAVDLLHPHGHQAVVDQDHLVRPDLLVQILIGDGHLMLVAGHVLRGEDEAVAGVQGDGAVGKGADTDLRALGVQDGGHRAADGVPDGVEPVQPLQMLLMGAMGEVEPGGIHPGADEPADHFLAVHRRAKSADDLRATHDTPPAVEFFLYVHYTILFSPFP